MSAIDKQGTIIRINEDPPQSVFVFTCGEEDLPYLPTEDVGSGSVAIVADTGARYIYHEDLGWCYWG